MQDANDFKCLVKPHWILAVRNKEIGKERQKVGREGRAPEGGKIVGRQEDGKCGGLSPCLLESCLLFSITDL